MFNRTEASSFSLARQSGMHHLNRVHEAAAHLPSRQLLRHQRPPHLPGAGAENDL